MLSTNQFCMNIETKTFSAEISSLGGNVFERVYADACDLGLTLVSCLSGKHSDWVVNDIEYAADDGGDLVCWTLVPMAASLVRSPKLAGWKIKIFND